MDLSTKLVGDFCVTCAITIVAVLSVVTLATIVWMMFVQS